MKTDANLLRYQDFISLIRRFDRDLLIQGMSQSCLGWDGNPFGSDGRPKEELPWNFAGAAAVAITRGTTGGKQPRKIDLLHIASEFSRIQTPQQLDGSQETYGLLLRWAYEQWPFNRVTTRDWARCVCLFDTTPFLESYLPEVMRPGWQDELLGGSVTDFVTVGGVLWASCNQGNPFPFRWDGEMKEIPEAFGGEERFDSFVVRNFTTDIDTFKVLRRDIVEGGMDSGAQKFLREPFAFNPLLSTPLVRGAFEDKWLAPCPPTLNLKTSPVGLAYAGSEKWGVRFRNDLGHRFEQYVGRQLRSNDEMYVRPEVVYGKDQRTIDWFVVTPEVVLLVECKSAMPAQSIREGLVEHVDSHRRALAKGIKQLNRTLGLFRARSTVLDFLPNDRPVLSLLVTLGNFDMVDQPFVQTTLPKPDGLTAVVGVDFIERFVAMDAGERRALAESAPDFENGRNFISVPAWTEGRTAGSNVLLEEAYRQLPMVALATKAGVFDE